MPPRTNPWLSRWIPALTGSVLAVPFLFARYPPMGDLAFHEAAVGLLKHWGDPRYLPPELYRLNLGEPNQLFHGLAYLLSLVVRTDAACKVVVAGAVIGVATGAAALAKHLGVTPWAAVIVAPLALGWMTRWGLVANLLGFALLLGALPTLDRAAEKPSLRLTSAALGLTSVLYFAHESALALSAVAALLFASRTPRRALPLASALSPGLLACGLAFAYHLRSQSLKAPSILAVTTIDVPLVRRLVDAPSALYSLGQGSGLMLGASVLGWGWLAALSRRAPDEDGATPRRARWPFLALGAVSLLAYLALPEALFGSTLVYQRFLPPAFALLVLATLPRARLRSAPAGWLAPLVLLLPLGMLAATAHAFVQSDRSYRDLDAVLDTMADGAAVAQLDLTPRNPSDVAPVVGAAARALAVHGGRLLFSFTDAPTYPVTMVPERRWDNAVARLASTPFAFAPAYDFTRFRYALVFAPAPRVRAVLPAAFSPEGKLVSARGSWLVFESTLPVAPVAARDEPFPSSAPSPLATRVKALLTPQRERVTPGFDAH